MKFTGKRRISGLVTKPRQTPLGKKLESYIQALLHVKNEQSIVDTLCCAASDLSIHYKTNVNSWSEQQMGNFSISLTL